MERLHIVAGRALMHARVQEERLRATGEVFGVGDEDIPRTSERFFEEWKSQRKRIEALEGEIGRLKLSGGGSASTVVDGIRYVVMEVDGDLEGLAIHRSGPDSGSRATHGRRGRKSGWGREAPRGHHRGDACFGAT